MTIREYRADPCGALSIPYWKAKSLVIPDTMRVLHHRDFDPALLARYEEQVFFRLRHDLNGLSPAPPPGIELRTARSGDLDRLTAIINASYRDLRVSREQLLGYTRTPAYDPELWILALEPGTGQELGCGIADFDPEAGEVSLEWIQVLPRSRRRGVGRAIVEELLRRSPPGADFATVSGRADGLPSPEGFYRRCGFTGEDLWHILREKPVL